MTTPIRVAAAQLAPAFLDLQKTVEIACRAIAEAGSEGAELIVFPEAFLCGYPDWTWLIPNSRKAELDELYEVLLAQSVSVPDQATGRICQAAREAGINVVVGINERNAEKSGASLYNSLLFIDADGNILGTHRKLIPTGGERLIWGQGDGSSLRSYHTSAGSVAGLICWENYMPLARQAIFEAGAQILAAPTWDKSANWLQSMQHIAREGGLFVISCCMALPMKAIPDSFAFKAMYPEGREWVNTGNSCIIGPDGKFLAGPLEARQGILYADLDPGQIVRAKRLFDAAGHYARPDVFSFALRDLRKGS